ncbi:MAG: low specificity L-threonine aldolase [Myxococcales bacterium]|nr:low specificity L-threonine aldolase [Myxococcales bacterium]
MLVDLRSDTVTRPSAAMRQAMATADVGDDGFRDDPTLIRLETTVAALLGKEAALFVPSGTMANQIAIRLQTQPGDEVLCHQASHIFDHECGGAAAISGVTLRPLDSADGTLPPASVRRHLHVGEDGRTAPTTLLCLENTHNDRGGRVLPPGHGDELAALVRPAGVSLHLDGARLFNAQVASDIPVSTLAAPFNTVSVCMSKGLGAPVGSLLVGAREHCERGRRIRRYLGGLMRQAGVLAAAALHGLEHNIARLAHDHERAALLGRSLAAMPHVTVVTPQTNLVYFALQSSHPLRQTGAATELTADLAANGVRITGDGIQFRAVTHLDVDDAGLQHAIAVIARTLNPAIQIAVPEPSGASHGV